MKYSLLGKDNGMHGQGFIKRFILNIVQIVFSSIIVIFIVDSVGFYKCKNYEEYNSIKNSYSLFNGESDNSRSISESGNGRSNNGMFHFIIIITY